MYTQYDKAIAAAVIAVAGLLALIFHWSIPGWFTETNILEFLTVAVPIVVGLVPNKATTAQKAEAAAVAASPKPS
jgi:hypothetical protein